MEYTIKQFSELTGLPASTLRYYESEKLLPEVKRNASGRRVYTGQDLDWISIITCLKDTNMPISDIKRFVALCAQGDSTLEERRTMVLCHQRAVQEQMKKLKGHLEHINHKVEYYNAACAAGSEAPLKRKKSAG